MNRQFLIWIVFLASTALTIHGQTAYDQMIKMIYPIDSLHLPQTADGSVKIFLSVDSNGYSTKYFIKFKNGEIWDTLSFAQTKISAINGLELSTVDSIKLTEVQIDGKGKKEIVLAWNGSSRSNLYGNTASIFFISTFKMNVIWNLDNRKKMFSAKNYSYCTSTTEYQPNKSIRQDTCSYSYNFIIADSGTITIKNLKGATDKFCCLETTDHIAGIYIYKEGQYIWTKK